MPGHKLIGYIGVQVIMINFFLGWANIFWRGRLIAGLAVTMHFIVTFSIFNLCQSTVSYKCTLFYSSCFFSPAFFSLCGIVRLCF